MHKLPNETSAACAKRWWRALYFRTNRPVIITLGLEGIYLLEDLSQAGIIIPANPVNGPVDVVGAGDSVNASAGAALCAFYPYRVFAYSMNNFCLRSFWKSMKSVPFPNHNKH